MPAAAATKTRVFIDTGILVSVLRGEPEVKHLFDADKLDHTEFISSPVVLQELLLSVEATTQADVLERLTAIVEVRPITASGARRGVEYARRFRGGSSRRLHPNDVLNIAAAIDSDCEYFLTADRDLLTHSAAFSERLRFVTPREFLGSRGDPA